MPALQRKRFCQSSPKATRGTRDKRDALGHGRSFILPIAEVF
jgi:hypothetical protein